MTQQNAPLQLLTIAEVADQIGLTFASFKQLRYKGGGPVAVKLGRRVRFRQADVDAWLAGNLERSA